MSEVKLNNHKQVIAQAIVKIKKNNPKHKNYTPLIAQILAKFNRAENRKNAVLKYLIAVKNIENKQTIAPHKININI